MRKEKTRQVLAMEAPPDAEPTHGDGHFDGRKRDGRLAYIESVITSFGLAATSVTPMISWAQA